IRRALAFPGPISSPLLKRRTHRSRNGGCLLPWRRIALLPRVAEMNMANGDWWRRGVVYQIYPRSFQDSNGDGIGDLEGVRSRLDYLVRLGVDAIWISPFYSSPMADFGYDVADYCNVDPLFGDLAAFDRLLADAHGRGLKVI